MSTSNLVAVDALSYCGTSFTTPSYTLPWNLAQSSLNYDPHIVLRLVDPAAPIPTPVTPGFLASLAGYRRIEYYNPAAKTLIGPSVNCRDVYQFDPLVDYAIDTTILNDTLQTADIVYQYTVSGRLFITPNLTKPAPVVNVWSIDLKASTGFYNVDVGDVPIAGGEPSAGGLICTKKAIGGSIDGVPFDNVTLLDPANPFAAGPNQYLLTGNRFWLFSTTAKPYTDPVDFQINFQIVERPTPKTICEYSRPLSNPRPCCL